MGGHHNLTEFEKFPGIGASAARTGADCTVEDYVSGSPRDLAEATLQPLPHLGDRELPGQPAGAPPLQGRRRRRADQLPQPEEQPRLRRVGGRQPVQRRGALRHPHGARRLRLHRPPHQEDPVAHGGRLHPGQLERRRQGHGQPRRALRRPVLLQHRGQHRPLPAEPVVAAAGASSTTRTQSGRSKVFVSYARYYENAPLDFADVILVGEPQLHGGHACDPRVLSQQRNECQLRENLRPNSQEDPRAPNKIFTGGGLPGNLDPDIRASSSDELLAGHGVRGVPRRPPGRHLHPPLDQLLDRGHGPGGRAVRLHRQPRLRAGRGLPQGRAQLQRPHRLLREELLQRAGWPRRAIRSAT